MSQVYEYKGNTWTVDFLKSKNLTFEQAWSSLQNCRCCHNCLDCTDCHSCIECTNCTNSHKCLNCDNLHNCNHCTHCNNLDNCSYCIGCIECIKCTYCVDCIDCNQCVWVCRQNRLENLNNEITDEMIEEIEDNYYIKITIKIHKDTTIEDIKLLSDKLTNITGYYFYCDFRDYTIQKVIDKHSLDTIKNILDCYEWATLKE